MRRAAPGSRIPFNNAVGALVGAVHRIDAQNYNNWKDALAKAHEEGGDIPLLPKKLVTAVEQKLSNILNYSVSIDRHQGSQAQIIITFARKDGSSFEWQGLSDGEKQIMMLSMFLATSNESSFIFLADEPELYLNEARAIALWEGLERAFPNTVFLHATHNVSFATRPTVDRTFVIDLDRDVTEVDRSKPLSALTIREIVGTRIQLLRSNAATIFCEDELSKLMLEDLFKEVEIQAIPLSGCEAVKAAVQGEPGWEQVRSASTAFCGVIDRDARGDDDVATLEGRRIYCLPVWDAEALMLAPKIGTWMLSRLLRRPFSDDQYLDILIDCARHHRDFTLHRIQQYLCWREKPVLTFDAGGLNARSQPPANLVALFNERAAQLEKAIVERDALAILRLHYGKPMYKRFVQLVREQLGISLPKDSPLQKYIELRDTMGFHDTLQSIEWLAAFKQKIEVLALTEPA